MKTKMDEYKISVNEYLITYFKDKGSYNKLIYNAMEYSIRVGGKRIRPTLMMMTYKMYKNKYKDIIQMAAAIEMIHTYSLIHDDLPCMDNDDLRRGMPTNHKKFGEGIAVLAGDALLNEAMNLMINYSLKNNKNALEATREIAEAAGVEGMIGGQVVDIINEGKDVSKDELNYMHLKKTGELIRSSIVAGAILGGASKEDIKILNEYGKKLGLAFQIKDDILDLIGDSSKLGKKVKSDKNNNKSNFLSTYGIDYCERMCNKLTEECINLLGSLSKNAMELREITLSLLNREY